MPYLTLLMIDFLEVFSTEFPIIFSEAPLNRPYIEHLTKLSNYWFTHWLIMACITHFNCSSRMSVEIPRSLMHGAIQLQNLSVLRGPCLRNEAISGVDLPNPMIQSNVGLTTDSQASFPGVKEWIGLVAKQDKGSFSLLRGTEAGRLAMRSQSL